MCCPCTSFPIWRILISLYVYLETETLLCLSRIGVDEAENQQRLQAVAVSPSFFYRVFHIRPFRPQDRLELSPHVKNNLTGQ